MEVVMEGERTGTSAQTARHGVPFDVWGLVLAGLSDGFPLEELLVHVGVDEGRWRLADAALNETLLDDVEAGGTLSEALDEAMSDARKRWTRAIPPLDVELRAWLDFYRAWAEAEAPLEDVPVVDPDPDPPEGRLTAMTPRCRCAVRLSSSSPMPWCRSAIRARWARCTLPGTRRLRVLKSSAPRDCASAYQRFGTFTFIARRYGTRPRETKHVPSSSPMVPDAPVEPPDVARMGPGFETL
jgi:hypothetical protein